MTIDTILIEYDYNEDYKHSQVKKDIADLLTAGLKEEKVEIAHKDDEIYNRAIDDCISKVKELLNSPERDNGGWL